MYMFMYLCKYIYVMESVSLFGKSYLWDFQCQETIRSIPIVAAGEF